MRAHVRRADEAHQLICTIPPLITVIASPLILVCEPDTSAVLDYKAFLDQLERWGESDRSERHPGGLDVLGVKYLVTPPGTRPPQAEICGRIADVRAIQAGADALRHVHVFSRAGVRAAEAHLRAIHRMVDRIPERLEMAWQHGKAVPDEAPYATERPSAR